MKVFLVGFTTTLLLIAAFGTVSAQDTPPKTAQPMPMMKGMMGQNEGGMRCPMCGQMMSADMMGGMMGNQGGMMGEMPMMGNMMQQMMGGQGTMMGKMQKANLVEAQALLAVSDDLKLTGEQIQSLKTIALRSQKELIKKHADLAVAQLELNALLDGEPIEIEQVRQKLNQAATFEVELKLAHIEGAIAAKAVLTPEQRAHFKGVAKKGMPKPEGKKAEKAAPEASEHEQHH